MAGAQKMQACFFLTINGRVEPLRLRKGMLLTPKPFKLPGLNSSSGFEEVSCLKKLSGIIKVNLYKKTKFL